MIQGNEDDKKIEASGDKMKIEQPEKSLETEEEDQEEGIGGEEEGKEAALMRVPPIFEKAIIHQVSELLVE